MSFCAWGCNCSLPLSPFHISSSTVPVCWRPVIHTQFHFTYWQYRVGGNNKRRSKINGKWLLMSRSSMFDLSWEHQQPPWEVHLYSTSHSSCWLPCAIPSTSFFEGHRLCGGPSKHIFSVALKGSQAPDSRFVWSDISVPLHSLLCYHDLGYIIKQKNK